MTTFVYRTPNRKAVFATKNDESYTHWTDFEREANACIESDRGVFCGKVVLLSCEARESLSCR